MFSQCKAKARNLWREMRKYKHVYIWVAPFFIIYIVFYLWPIFFSFFLCFYQWTSIGPLHYVGLNNFFSIFRSALLWKSLYNTFYLWVAIVPLRTFLSLVIAVILTSRFIRFKSFFQLLVILPYITAGVIIAIVFQIILVYHGGLLNNILNYLGIKAIPWLNSTKWSKISIAILDIWHSIGFWTLIMMGGLQRIPPELYEVASIDGANRFNIFWRITVPIMKPVIFFVVLVSTIWLFKMFTEPYLLTEGGPQYSSYTMGYLLYTVSFKYFKFGEASSIGIFTFLLVWVIALVQRKIGEIREE